MPRSLPRLRAGALAAVLVLAASHPAQAQLDTTNIPTRPAKRLAAFEQFFGRYVYTDNQYGGLGPWRGTLTVRPAVKEWYVELDINTRFGPIDRQLMMLTTWDDVLGRYRVWGFDTQPPGRVEGEGRFDGDEFIVEWKGIPGPHGEPPGTLRDRIRMEGADTLVIVTEVVPSTGKTFQLGLWKAMRIARD